MPYNQIRVVTKMGRVENKQDIDKTDDSYQPMTSFLFKSEFVTVHSLLHEFL